MIYSGHAEGTAGKELRMSLNVSFFTGYGKIGNYTKTQTMKQKWKNRKSTNDFTSKETKAIKYDTRNTSEKVRDMLLDEANKIKESFEELQRKNEDSGSRMTEIRNKYMAGGKLTAEEMEYVSKKDPKLYQEIKAEEQEIKSFEKRLRAAKTKEEAQRVIQEDANTSLSKVKSVTNDPHISDADKMAVCAAEYRKLVKKQEIFAKFAEKGEYHKLPTEAEKQKAEKEIQEAREEALREDPLSKDPESNNLHSDKTVSDEANAVDFLKKTQPGQNKPELNPEEDESRSKTLAKSSGQKQAKSIVEAENTPEARKTKRAKQKRGYGKLFSDDSSAEGAPSHVWEA